MASGHNLSFTYAPKIQAVKEGKCRQTIRLERKRKIRPGDRLHLHTWQGKPYRSKWGWRKTVVCVEAIDIKITPENMRFSGKSHRWEELDELARKDGIDPPTGEELRKVLVGLNDEACAYGQIIRW